MLVIVDFFIQCLKLHAPSLHIGVILDFNVADYVMLQEKGVNGSLDFIMLQ